MISLPKNFIDSIPLSTKERNDLLQSLQTDSPTSIRINSNKVSPLELEKVEWCNQGYYLEKRPVFTFDPLFHSGAYYVQEASSMFIGSLVEALNTNYSFKHVLDLCAAPGGKSTHLLSVLDEEAVLVSNEVVRQRVNILMENITKWGNANSIVTHNEAKDFSDAGCHFDLVVIDAPCSGEGMFRKDPDAVKEWSEENVQMCASRQKDILENIYDALNPGGILIYSTCTYNEKENEEIVKLLSEEFELEDLEALELNIPNEIVQNKVNGISTFRFFPHKIKGEGLFVAVMRKKEKLHNLRPNNKVRPERIKEKDLELLIDRFTDELFQLFKVNEHIHFASVAAFKWYHLFKNKLKIVKAGTRMGTWKGKEFIPDHELVLSNHINRISFPNYELSYEDAILVLTKNSPEKLPDHKGWGYFTYQNIPLAFYKSIPGRINNYLPKELKIRMNYDKNQQFSVLIIK